MTDYAWPRSEGELRHDDLVLYEGGVWRLVQFENRTGREASWHCNLVYETGPRSEAGKVYQTGVECDKIRLLSELEVLALAASQ